MQFFHIFPGRHVHSESLTLFPLRFRNIFLFQRQIYPFYLEILDACNAQSGEDKKIIVRAKTDDHSLCVTIDNTFSGSLDIDQEGHFVSSKHEGLGLGTESIKRIAERYGGVCQFEANNGMFYASVMCFKDHA